MHKMVMFRWIETETSSRPLSHHAAAFLLATGGVLGGGFSGDVGRLQEVVFDLPLDAPTNRSHGFTLSSLILVVNRSSRLALK